MTQPVKGGAWQPTSYYPTVPGLRRDLEGLRTWQNPLRFNSEFFPSETNRYSLGEKEHQWRYIHARGIRIGTDTTAFFEIGPNKQGLLTTTVTVNIPYSFGGCISFASGGGFRLPRRAAAASAGSCSGAGQMFSDTDDDSIGADLGSGAKILARRPTGTTDALAGVSGPWRITNTAPPTISPVTSAIDTDFGDATGANLALGTTGGVAAGTAIVHVNPNQGVAATAPQITVIPKNTGTVNEVKLDLPFAGTASLTLQNSNGSNVADLTATGITNALGAGAWAGVAAGPKMRMSNASGAGGLGEIRNDVQFGLVNGGDITITPGTGILNVATDLRATNIRASTTYQFGTTTIIQGGIDMVGMRNITASATIQGGTINATSAYNHNGTAIIVAGINIQNINNITATGTIQGGTVRGTGNLRGDTLISFGATTIVQSGIDIVNIRNLTMTGTLGSISTLTVTTITTPAATDLTITPLGNDINITDADVNPTTDGTRDLGDATHRWSTLFLSTGLTGSSNLTFELGGAAARTLSIQNASGVCHVDITGGLDVGVGITNATGQIHGLNVRGGSSTVFALMRDSGIGAPVVTSNSGVGTLFLATNDAGGGPGTVSIPLDNFSVGGTITGSSTITGTTLNCTTGLNTGAGAGTNRITNAGALVNITTLTLTGAISGGTTYSGSGNINSTGGAIQTNSTTRITNGGVTNNLEMNGGATGCKLLLKDGSPSNNMEITFDTATSTLIVKDSTGTDHNITF